MLQDRLSACAAELQAQQRNATLACEAVACCIATRKEWLMGFSRGHLAPKLMPVSVHRCLPTRRARMQSPQKVRMASALPPISCIVRSRVGIR